jgi:hypothetical protein
MCNKGLLNSSLLSKEHNIQTPLLLPCLLFHFICYFFSHLVHGLILLVYLDLSTILSFIFSGPRLFKLFQIALEVLMYVQNTTWLYLLATYNLVPT